jgi:hypothetical protein
LFTRFFFFRSFAFAALHISVGWRWSCRMQSHHYNASSLYCPSLRLRRLSRGMCMIVFVIIVTILRLILTVALSSLLPPSLVCVACTASP